MKLFIDPDSMKALYTASPAWLKALMDAYADGLNYYLYKHPEVRPRVIRRFEPWMALTFTEGSIGGDIETINIGQLAAFYGTRRDATPTGPSDGAGEGPTEPSGSNGIAIAPSNTRNGHALLLINPHTSFFFRSEVHVTSDEGLNAYGAVTWGQFFVYQGFNERAGWMHTSSNVDAIDEYAETILRRGDRVYYRYAAGERPVVVDTIVVPYRDGAAGMGRRTFVVYKTHHGPVVRETDGKWVSVRLMQKPIEALTQSYTRTKARNYREFLATMRHHTNSSNNTIFADGEGNIAYFHANFIPRRDARFDWSRPVAGSDSAAEWGAPLRVEESPLVLNPSTGWLYNTNDAPWWAAGASSPRKADYPAYVEGGGENARGVHAIRVLEGKKDFTLQSLIDAAYDSYLPAFATMIPELLEAYDGTPVSNPLKATLVGQIGVLRDWDFRWSVTSVPTSLAVFYGEQLGNRASTATPQQRLRALAAASDKLTTDFGSWRTPWGQINRFQRLTGDIVQPFSDGGPSIPVGFTSGRWGSLASFGARPYRGTKRWYGTSGNSFVAVVEFGDSVRARAISAGGESGDPRSPHFNDQAQRYATGNLREVYFYPAQIEAHAEKRYRPGN
jgi:acyl-homoserine-lactone acylase